jgi:uncharacterized protein (UPF0212 family)
MSAGPSPLQRLLETWEQAWREPPSRRAATILTVLAGEANAVALPIGDRDRKLFELLAAHYGQQLSGLAECPECGAAIEIAADVQALMAGGTAGPFPVATGSDTVLVRHPDTSDIEATAAAADPARCLAERCSIHEGELSDEAVARIADAILDADPLLDLEIGVTCPSCGHDAAFAFDVAAYLWERIDASARQAMRQVDRLARAYGWSEAEILALPPGRRTAYLSMVEP